MKKFINLYRQAFQGYTIPILILTALSFIGGFLEGIGINSIIPLFSLADPSQHKATDFISRNIEKGFLFFNIQYALSSLVIFIIAMLFFKVIAVYFANVLTAKIAADYETNTRNNLLRLTLRADWPYLSKQKIGHLDQMLTTSINNSSGLLYNISSGILVLANLIIYTLLVINISVAIAAITFIAGIIIFIILKPLFRKTNAITKNAVSQYKELAHYINENIINMKAIKALFVEEPVLESGQRYFNEIKKLNLELVSFRNITNSITQMAGVIFIIGIFSFFYKTTSSFNFASFAVIVYAVQKIFLTIQMAQSQVHNLNTQIPHLESILEYKNEAEAHKEKNIGTNDFQFMDALEFKEIGFTYNSHKEAIAGINFKIKKNEMIGLIGPSGSGKTTITDLLLRLLQAQKGIITLDGKDISAIKLSEWRTYIGYVSQEVLLVNDTIKNNIRFYNKNITDEDIIMASKMANLYDFIQSQPEKFNSLVGERGLALSGGQRQRIALARVLARKPQILILDEATSSLDNESEALIQKAIKELKGKITVIIIAHRLSTIMIADRLIVLENGQITELGSPKNLLENQNSYFSRISRA
ncbi:MAG: ABC transporter ATP-binding protein [bacterium]|nr:ABC transporter ATP-binding protein [bacterium]